MALSKEKKDLRDEKSAKLAQRIKDKLALRAKMSEMHETTIAKLDKEIEDIQLEKDALDAYK